MFYFQNLLSKIDLFFKTLFFLKNMALGKRCGSSLKLKSVVGDEELRWVCEVCRSIWEEEDFDFESFLGFGDRFGSENAIEEHVWREIGFEF